jgi:hypothetical protein
MNNTLAFWSVAVANVAKSFDNERVYVKLAVIYELSRSTMVAPLDENDTRVWETILTGVLEAYDADVVV